MWRDYFIVAGVLFVCYCVGRLLLALQLRESGRMDAMMRSDWKHSDLACHPIDTSPLAGRVQHVRQDYADELHSRPPQFKKDLLVHDKREEIAHSAYFEHLPENHPEPEDEEHDAGLFPV